MAHIHVADLLDELEFSASRSSGPGGQHVNKVSSKVSLRFDVRHSKKLTAEQREVLINKWANRLTNEGVLLLQAQEKRSQLQNKEEVLVKLESLLVKAFTMKKARKATKPSKAAKRKRIDSKKQRGEKKQWRQKP